MPEDVYIFLKNYGFTKEDLSSFETENEKIYFTNIDEIKKNIGFLLNKELSKNEIIQVIRKNPFMLTINNNRLEAINKIYITDLHFNILELKKLILSNPDVYISSPVELNKNIEFLKEHNGSLERIKAFFLKYPYLVSLSFEEFKDNVQFK